MNYTKTFKDISPETIITQNKEARKARFWNYEARPLSAGFALIIISMVVLLVHFH